MKEGGRGGMEGREGGEGMEGGWEREGVMYIKV